jgi:hypothetical protein
VGSQPTFDWETESDPATIQFGNDGNFSTPHARRLPQFPTEKIRDVGRLNGQLDRECLSSFAALSTGLDMQLERIGLRAKSNFDQTSKKVAQALIRAGDHYGVG